MPATDTWEKVKRWVEIETGYFITFNFEFQRWRQIKLHIWTAHRMTYFQTSDSEWKDFDMSEFFSLSFVQSKFIVSSTDFFLFTKLGPKRFIKGLLGFSIFMEYTI